MLDLALNRDEAAAVTGVHFASIKKLVEQGELLARSMGSAYSSPKSNRRHQVFSLDDCERNYAEYQAAVVSDNVGPGRRRECLDRREEVRDLLARCSPQIHYSDAISVSEAAELLGVHPSYIPRLIDRAEIAARKPWNPRSEAPPRLYIVSRVSCEKHMRTLRLDGRKTGRPRTGGQNFPAVVVKDFGSTRAVDEGRIVDRMIKRRERKKKIISLKKKQVLQATKALLCEVCAFDFCEFYGGRGSEYAECHHRVPMSASDAPRRTHLDDLAIVCANCHRMLHQRPPVTVEDLRRIVEARRPRAVQ
jgi:hypothetical protein